MRTPRIFKLLASAAGALLRLGRTAGPQPEIIVVGGRQLRRISECEYEAADLEKGVDFHFVVLPEMVSDEFDHQVEIHIYDIHVADPDEAYMDTAYAVNLEEAVLVAYGYFTSVEHDECDPRAMYAFGRATKRVVISPFVTADLVKRLRAAAAALEAEPGGEARNVFFPNWDNSDERTELIREAARTVWASYDPEGDGGGHTSKKALGTLVRYVADMLEA
ncbi:MAG: hypothetical protein ACJ74Q_15670 [Pyrinomonadaceae bacterium]